jgi:hypothetical protein
MAIWKKNVIWFGNTFLILKTTRFLSLDILVIIGGIITILGRNKFIPRNYSTIINTLIIEAKSTMIWNGSQEGTMVEPWNKANHGVGS